MRVFISYHTPDLETARSIESALARRRPGTECYLAPRNNTAGAYWLPALADEIARADAVLFLAGARIGPWQELEYYEALRLSRGLAGRPRLVPVVTAGQAPGLPFFAQLHHIFAPEPTAPDCLAAIERALEDASAPDATPAWARFQPYKGLPALQEADAAFFFGRNAETAEILELIAGRPDRIIALVGQSGVGKSSLARAGVLAALRSQEWPLATGRWPAGLKDSRAFLPLVVRAGEAPLKELALAFTRLYRTEPSEIEREARGWVENFMAGSGLGDLLRVTRDSIAEALGAEPPRRFMLYLDQGEELYAAGNADVAPQARRFSTLLAEAAGHEAFSVLMSLRSDYYAAYQNDTDLFHASDRVDVLPLGQEVLTEIIRRPALTLQARFESDDMAERVAAASVRQPGALPLLSDLMHDLWLNMQARGDGVLRWSDNPEIVDIGAPLRRRAEAFLERPDSDPDALRRLFILHLAQVPKTGDPVRRRARRSECTAAEWHLAETLADQDWRLLSLARAGDDEPTAEVAHDQLLRSWPRLTGWLEEEREFLVWRAQVEAAVEEQEDDLLSGRRLAVARGWFERRADDLAPGVRAFIAASIEADDRRIATERRRRQRIFAATASGLVGALILAGLAGWQWRSAEAEKEHAQRSLDLATRTANALVFDLVQKYRNAGVPASVIADILAHARQLQDQLTASGETSPDLRRSQAEALMETVNTLLTTGDTAGALAAAQKAHDIFEALLAASPDSTDYQRELSVSEEKIGDVLLAQGDLAGALAAYRDDLAISKALAAKDPGNTEWRRDLAVSDERIGNVLLAQGNLAGALAQYRAELAIMEPLAKSDPTNTDGRRFISVVYSKIGNVLRDQGDLAGALAAYRDGLAIMKVLAAKDPGNTQWQRDLSISENNIGGVLQAQGDLPGALTAYRDDLAISKALAAKDPGNTEWRRDLAVSDERIGNVLLAQGDLPGALAAYRDSLAIMKVLAAKDPGNTLWQRDLSVSDNKIGGVLRDQGDLAGALAAYRDGLAIMKVLAAKAPGNTQWQRDLSISNDRVGDVLLAQGDLPGALAAYRDDLAISKALAAKDPGNTEWQRDLSISDSKIGNVLRDQGDLAGALAAYRDGLAISKALAAKDPGNTQWQRDFLLSIERMGLVASRQNDLAGALEAFEQAEKIALQVKAANPTAATSASDLEWVQARLAETRQKLAAAGPKK